MLLPIPCMMSCMIRTIANLGILICWKALIYAESVLTVILVTMQVSICLLSDLVYYCIVFVTDLVMYFAVLLKLILI